MNDRVLLRIDHLHIAFETPDGVVEAVTDLSFDLKPGEVLGIAGESGSGKSQTCMAVLGLLANNARVEGRIEFEGKNLLDLTHRELNRLRGKNIAMVFQDPMTSLNPYMRIGQQLLEALRVHNRALSRVAARERCLEMLARVALTNPANRFDQYPHELSGGMRQRVMIAMALINQPKILIADEPTTALDVTIQAEILSLLRALQQDMGMAVIFITHDLAVIAQLCDRVALMYRGQLQEIGPTKNILTDSDHPYTQKLLAATPRIESDSKRWQNKATTK